MKETPSTWGQASALPTPTPPPGLAASLAAALPVAAWMSGALMAFCVLAVVMRDLSHDMGPFEINGVRTGGGLLATVAYMAATGARPRVVDARNLGALAARNAVHWGASLLWTLSVSLVPLAMVFSIEFTTPIWVAVLGGLLLGLRTSRRTASAMALGFVGVLVVVEPSRSSLSAYVLLPILTAAGLGLATLLTKRLTRRNDVVNIVFWMMCLQFAANVVVVAATVGLGDAVARFAAGGAVTVRCLVLVACGVLSQVCLTNALRIGNPVTVVSIDFLRMPLIALVGYLLYGEVVGAHTVLGTLAIVTSVVVITVNGERDRLRASASTALAQA